MAGLGFANPELMNAVKLAVQHGSTALPQMTAGAGQPGPAAAAAPPPSSVGQLPYPSQMKVAPPPGAVAPLPMPTPQIDTQANAAPPPTKPVPEDGKTDPHWWEVAGAIGHVILSVDAGLRNQPMPEPPGGDPREAQDQEMQVQEFTMNTVTRAWEAWRKAPPDQKGKVLEMFQSVIDKVQPGFDLDGFIKGMMDDSDWADMVAPDLAVLSPEGKSMFMAKVRQMGGDPAAAAAAVVKDEAFMKSLFDVDDQRNIPVLKFKLQKMRAALASMNMDPDTFADMTLDDLMRINANLPESVQLTPSELATMKRHPDLGTIIGMRSTGGSEPRGPESAPSIDRSTGYTPPPSQPSRRPPATPPRRPAPQSEVPAEGDAPRRPAPRVPARPVAPSTSPPSQGRPQTPPSAGPRRPAAPPHYPPGWKPRTPNVPVQKVEAVGKRPKKQDAAPPPAAPPPQQPAPREQRFRVPKDTNIPGFGNVKKGEIIIYDPVSGSYRRP